MLHHLARAQQVFRRQGAACWTPRDLLAREHECVREVGSNEIVVVKNSDDGAASRAPSMDDLYKALGGARIDSVQRLIQKHKPRVLHQCARKERALKLTPREGCDRPALETTKANIRDRFSNRFTLAAGDSAERANPRVHAERHETPNIDRKVSINLGELRQVRNIPALQIATRDLPFQRPYDPCKSLEKRRLACAVRPCDGQEVACMNNTFNMMNRRPPSIAQRNILDANKPTQASPQAKSTLINAAASSPSPSLDQAPLSAQERSRIPQNRARKDTRTWRGSTGWK